MGTSIHLWSRYKTPTVKQVLQGSIFLPFTETDRREECCTGWHLRYSLALVSLELVLLLLEVLLTLLSSMLMGVIGLLSSTGEFYMF